MRAYDAWPTDTSWCPRLPRVPYQPLDLAHEHDLFDQPFPKICPRVPKIEKCPLRPTSSKQTAGCQVNFIYSWNFYWFEMERMRCFISVEFELNMDLSLQCCTKAMGAKFRKSSCTFFYHNTMLSELHSSVDYQIANSPEGKPFLSHLCIPNSLLGTSSTQQMFEFVN